MDKSSRALLAAFLLATSSLAAVHQNSATLPSIHWDFVVVGGGAAGSVIANRLSENPTFNVLLLEAGPQSEDVMNVTMPFTATLLAPNTPYDWNLTTIPQENLDGRILPYPRGHLLGGSTSVNYMVYTKGADSDYDRFANVTGDAGWSWDNLQPYFHKVERWVTPLDGHNITGTYDPSAHGTSGMVSVGVSQVQQPVDPRIIQTTVELADDFPFNVDMNAGNPLGLGWAQFTIGSGERSSAARAYLADKFTSRPNLHVLLNTRATTIQPSSSHSLDFRTVNLVSGSHNITSSVTASKELILSVGAVATPQILMHSGIGDEAQLKNHSIPVLTHLPGVGQNLTDHPMVYLIWRVNSTKTFESWTHNRTLQSELIQQWEKNHTGYMADSYLDHLSWSRAEIPEGESDPSSGPHAPHIEHVYFNGVPPPNEPATGNYFAIAVAVPSPSSRGSIQLGSSNPISSPLIDPAFYATSFDMSAMAQGIKLAQKFVSAQAWDGYIIEPANFPANMTDAELEEYIRQSTISSYHPVSTCMMTPKNASHGVVNPDFKVKGVSGLRIIDASIFPYIPAAHTQAATYVVAERAADIIKQEWR